MNIKYYYEFKGHDNILNRVEILTEKAVVSQLIKVTYTPFVLEYSDMQKLDPILGSGATLNLISETIFQFENLHTDNMQEYLVKFYRNGVLYWMGWLDAELYEENLASYPPYPVEFTAADFNILERLKFIDSSGKKHVGINTLLVSLKICLEKLALPFNYLYIGCSTTADGIVLENSETILHKLYIQSSNFYDEDNDPMTCKEVVESILEPFGLMMVQRDASIYIFDYNTVMLGLDMKKYDYKSLAYQSDENVSFLLGDIADIGYRSENAPYGFEDLINNVVITSSLYADDINENTDLEEKYMSDKVDDGRPNPDRAFYRKSTQVENINGLFAVYYGRIYADYVGERDSILGCRADYLPSPATISPLFRIKSDRYITRSGEFDDSRDYPYLINLRMSAYASTSGHPILIDKVENVKNSEVIKLYCNLYIVDENDRILAYYNIITDNSPGWILTPNGSIDQGKCVLWFGNKDSEGSILDNWIVNANKTGIISNRPGVLPESLVGKGIYVTPELSGKIVFEITNKVEIYEPNSGEMVDENKVLFLLYDKINIDIVDRYGKTPSADDYEFSSYINDKVSSDYRDVSLKCISANEDKLPVGKGNILMKSGNSYDLQLSFTRGGQTNILERLLLCTIHSNYSRKNKIFTVDIKTTDNPAMRYSTLKNRWSDEKFLTSGCRIDFNRAITNLTVFNFSEDTDKLSDIPYE